MPAATSIVQKNQRRLSRNAAGKSHARHTRATDLVSALVKMYEDNASTLTPDPLHSAFYDSHPPASVRIKQLNLAAT